MKTIGEFTSEKTIAVSKNIFGLFILSVILASCSTTGQVSKTPDDLYYSHADRQSNQDKVNQYDAAPPVQQEQQQQQQEYVTDNNQNYDTNTDNNNQRSETDANGNTYITNNYYDGSTSYAYDDDDYYYTRNIRRWYSPYNGYNYYSDIYCNPYWYSYSPSYYSYYPGGFSFSISFGNYNPWWGCAYNNYYSPWYSNYYSPVL